MEIEIPDRLRKAVIFNQGETEGTRWLDHLPGILDVFASQWGLVLGAVAEGGAMSCCVFCRDAGGAELVIKVPVDAETGRMEHRSLRAWASVHAAPAVIASDDELGVFLMERVAPGDTAWPLGGVVDSRSFVDLVSRMARCDLADFGDAPPLEHVVRMRLTWAIDRFADERYEEPEPGVDWAADQLVALAESSEHVGLLHGDLQAKNVLVGPSGVLYAIDPFTCLCDPHAEAAFWAVMQDGPSTIQQRLAQLSEYGPFSEDRLTRWAQVFAVAEMRPYLRPSAERMTRFLRDTT